MFALIKAQGISLFRDRMALLLSFALPCVMFTVFAIIFGGQSGGSPSKMKVLVVDIDQTAASKAMIDSLKSMDKLEIIDAAQSTDDPALKAVELSAAPEALKTSVAAVVRKGKVAAAVIFPKGLQDSVAAFGQTERTPVQLIHDAANPLAEQMLTGLLQASAFTSAPDLLMEKGLEEFRKFGGPFSPLQEAAVATMKSLLNTQNESADGTESSDAKDDKAASLGTGMSMTDGLVKIESSSARDLIPDRGGEGSGITSAKMISYYAAGISVMFIMFSMSGASSSLLEHQERGTLERLLSGRMTIRHILLAHWAFYVALGICQMALMFVFASVVFGLDLWHVETMAGAAVMAIVSSMASAAFIMMIATLCRSRKQLEGLSSILILILSAMGGSMMPRFIMPDFVVKLSSVAFNSWSMDGFLKVFWYNSPETSIITSILPEVAVILSMAAIFLSVALVCARKWALG
jgi:ABC-2 type transport system permease protein